MNDESSATSPTGARATAARKGARTSVKGKKIAILVAGMHRSGTSALTRTLNLLGCDLPKTPSNDLDHWESKVIMNLNDEILASADSTWRDWEAFNPGQYASPVNDQFRKRAKAALESEFGDTRMFVLKDPRICRLLGFWVEAVEAFGATPLVVSPIRNPLEVAASLEARDGMDPSIAQLLWLRHVLDAEATSRNLKRAYMRYDDLIGDWRAVVDRLGDDLGVSWPRRSTSSDMEIEEYISPAQRHHMKKDASVLKNPCLSRWIRSSFEILDRWARGEVREMDMADLDRIKAAFDEAAPAFSRPVAVGLRSARRSRARDAEAEGLAAKFRARDAEAEGLAAKLRARERDIQKLKTSTSWRVTKPLRAVSRGLRWLLRNTRRALSLVWSLSIRQFSRAAKASLPYYQHFVPLRVKMMIPDRARELAKRRLTADGVSLPEYADPSLNKAISRAETASKAKDWPEAVRRWLSIMDGFGVNEELAGRAKLNISVARRLCNIDAYKARITKYVTARARRNSAGKQDKKIVIYTAISGGYDSVKLPEKPDSRVDYVLFTDTPVPDTGVYQVRPITYFHEDAPRAARFVKTHPHVLLEDYDLAIWIDANIMIAEDFYPLVEDFLASNKAVAAVPHPLRKSIYEELEACTRLKKDDPEIMREQLAHYRGKGFDHEDLIESMLMMFNLENERIGPFLDSWWTEIDRHSKRDQLSLNYALKQASVDWHRLTERPNSVRNHPSFAFVPHGSGDGSASRLLDALQVPLVDPYAGPPYADVRDERIVAQKNIRIDIVVCVHNALEDVKLCLESVRRARNSEHQRLIVIDDGSDQRTARYLEDFASDASWIELHRNEHASGYTKAANQGLAASTGGIVILLNSDTIVTDCWAEKMADAVFSTPGAGIVGPMSNAASHQSIPEHRSSKDQTAVNDLPPGLTAEDMNRYCEQWTAAHVLPRVPLVHGFCFGLTREVKNKIGLFDEDSFPIGYGEENDYCFRATDRGFGLVIATHTYIFHAKSKSYLGHERVALMKAGSETLKRLHGRGRIHRSVRSMQENPILEDLRRRARSLAESGTRSNRPIISSSAGDGQDAYDFVDFGCGAGGSIAFGKKCLGGRRGLGLDVNPKKVEAALAAGFDTKVADVTKLDPEDIGTVRFVIISHFLEHLADRKVAQACIESACGIAETFVFIRQPYFDADGYLFSLGLKLYWSDWTGHSYHMTSLELYNILNRLFEEGKVSRFLIFFRSEIENACHAVVHPLSSPKDQHKWNSKVHDPKLDHNFPFPVFHETGAIVLTKQGVLDGKIEKFLQSCVITFDSADGAANY